MRGTEMRGAGSGPDTAGLEQARLRRSLLLFACGLAIQATVVGLALRGTLTEAASLNLVADAPTAVKACQVDRTTVTVTSDQPLAMAQVTGVLTSQPPGARHVAASPGCTITPGGLVQCAITTEATQATVFWDLVAPAPGMLLQVIQASTGGLLSTLQTPAEVREPISPCTGVVTVEAPPTAPVNSPYAVTVRLQALGGGPVMSLDATGLVTGAGATFATITPAQFCFLFLPTVFRCIAPTVPGDPTQVVLAAMVNTPLPGTHMVDVQAVIDNQLPPVTSGATVQVVGGPPPPPPGQAQFTERRLVVNAPQTAPEGVDAITFRFRVRSTQVDVTVNNFAATPGGAQIVEASPVDAFAERTDARVVYRFRFPVESNRDVTGTVFYRALPGQVLNRVEASGPGLPMLTAEATTVVSAAPPGPDSTVTVNLPDTAREGPVAATLRLRGFPLQSTSDVTMRLTSASPSTRIVEAVPANRVTQLSPNLAAYRFAAGDLADDTAIGVVLDAQPGTVVIRAEASSGGPPVTGDATMLVVATGPTLVPNQPPAAQPGNFPATFAVTDVRRFAGLEVSGTLVPAGAATLRDVQVTVGNAPGPAAQVAPDAFRVVLVPVGTSVDVTPVNVVLTFDAAGTGVVMTQIIATADGNSTVAADATTVVTPGSPATTITAPAAGTDVPLDGTTAVRFPWDSQAATDLFFFEFSGQDAVFSNAFAMVPDPVNGFGGTGGGFVVSGRSLTAVPPATLPPGSRRIRVIPVSPDFLPLGPFSGDVSVLLTPAAPVVITFPPSGSRFVPGDRLTIRWTGAPTETFGLEHTGPNLRFTNPGGTGADGINGFRGAGGGFLVDGLEFSFVVTREIPTATYQARVFRLLNGQPVGQASAAVDIVIEAATDATTTVGTRPP